MRNGSTPTPFQWGGSRQYQADAESGLILMGARYYDPSLGRFISEDPARDETNWYAYCGNNPLAAVDPSGLVVEFAAGTTQDQKDAYRDAREYLCIDDKMRQGFELIEDSTTVWTVQFINNDDDHTDRVNLVIYWDPQSAMKTLDNSTPRKDTGTQTPAMGLGHELAGHAAAYERNAVQALAFRKTPAGEYGNVHERSVIEGVERSAALTLHEHPRHNHKGIPYRVQGPLGR